MALETILGIGTLLSGLFGGGSKKTENQTQSQTTVANKTATQFSPDVLAPLESLMKTLLGNENFQTAQSGLAGRLSQVQTAAAAPAFDVDAFVDDTMARAEATAKFDLESGLNKLFSGTGTSEGDNTMTALLANRLRTDTAANLAGIGAQARATGEQIRSTQSQGITSEITTLSNSIANQLIGLLDVGKGASVSSREETQQNAQSTGTAQDQKSFFDRLSSTLSTLNQSAQVA